ncbi:NADP-dependent oxidoreductase [Vibrio makurazakiensis]|uniref:NADP-dependent oxidoreductase n=1 Tax=Vibrio makurazakiensis TaxID=2910250 RepID=UPI003D0D9626
MSKSMNASNSMNLPKSMKAAVIKNWGSSSEFEIADLSVPAIGPTDVLVKVAYSGLNPADWKIRAGHLKAHMAEKSFPLAIGLDAAGTVVEVGESVTGISIGDRVASGSNLFEQGKHGSYAQYLSVAQSHVTKLPESVDFKTAASLPIAALTAWQALFSQDKGQLTSAEGKKVLINGASGGVGSFAVQLAKWQGAEVATTCSGRNIDYVTQLGSDLAIDYQTQNISRSILEWAPEGLDLIIDVVSGNSIDDPISLLKPGGKLVSIATITEDGDINASIQDAQERGREKIFAYLNDESFSQDLERVLELVEQQVIVPPQIQSIPMSDVAAAHERLESGSARGKLVLEVEGS